MRAFSSVGRASPLQGEGQKFESSNAHHYKKTSEEVFFLLYTHNHNDCIVYTKMYKLALLFLSQNCDYHKMRYNVYIRMNYFLIERTLYYAK